MPLESVYQRKVIKKVRDMFPDGYVIKTNSAYLQGCPDWLILNDDRWGMLEIKRKKPRPGSDDFEPNQEWYINQFDNMSFCACVYPENEREVLDAVYKALRTRRPTRLSKP